jgi:glycosyltransferase involved in cell wall biosynthesis
MDVHQFHPQVAYGDAASNHVLSLQRLLKGLGYRSEIFCEHQPFLFQGNTRPIAEYAGRSSPENVLLLHFTMGYSAEVMSWLDGIPDRKVVIYHNITPHAYFAGINGPLAEAAERGRGQLDQLRDLTAAGWGVSTFNCQELAERGWTDLRVLPIIFDPERYEVRPDRSVLRRYGGSRSNVLFVGRVAPNKRFEDLILAFLYLKRSVCPDARLLLVGAQGGMEPYVGFLRRLIGELRLPDVVFTGHVSNSELMAYYQCASLYLSLSEHEGFGVPLLESMHFGLPIVAYAAAAVPETLGGRGALVTQKDFPAIAELIGLLIEDEDLRGKIIAGQRKRLEDFLPRRVERRLETLLDDLSAG